MRIGLVSPAFVPLVFRDEPRASDAAPVRGIVASTGFFRGDEVEMAVELLEERLAGGLASGYHFLFADDPETGEPMGYACFGPIPCTMGSFDLYWIAVHDSYQRRGLGRALLAEVERRIALGLTSAGDAETAVSGRRVYIETSSLPKYEPTRAFYLRCGYVEEGRFEGFYREGDDKIVYSKRLE